MSVTGVTSFLSAMSDIVCCPTCARPAFVEDRLYLDSTDGFVEHVRISCPSGHSAVQQADRVAHVSLPTFPFHRQVPVSNSAGVMPGR